MDFGITSEIRESFQSKDENACYPFKKFYDIILSDYYYSVITVTLVEENSSSLTNSHQGSINVIAFLQMLVQSQHSSTKGTWIRWTWTLICLQSYIQDSHSDMSQNIVCVQLEKTGCFNHACIIQKFTIDNDSIKRAKMRDSLFSQFTRGGSRVVATSEMECFVIIVNGFQPLTITTKHSILDIAAALDSPLFTTYLRCGQIDFGANLLSFSPA